MLDPLIEAAFAAAGRPLDEIRSNPSPLITVVHDLVAAVVQLRSERDSAMLQRAEALALAHHKPFVANILD